jgi:tol-pal system protein YbgF
VRVLFWVILLAVTLPNLAACADKRLEAQMKDMETQVAELNRRITDAHVRIEDLSNRVFLIQEQLASLAETGDLRPPRRLPTVKLVPEKTDSAAKPSAGPESKQLTSPQKQDTYQSDSQDEPILISNWDDNTRAIAPKKAATPQAPKAAIETEYESALALFNNARYNEAIAAFADFLKRYPDTSYSDNAVFWTGLALFEQEEYTLAIDEFDRVLTFSRTNKAADALYYKGLSLLRSGRNDAAARVWRELIKRFPDHEAATRARSDLNAQPVRPNP